MKPLLIPAAGLCAAMLGFIATGYAQDAVPPSAATQSEQQADQPTGEATQDDEVADETAPVDAQAEGETAQAEAPAASTAAQVAQLPFLDLRRVASVQGDPVAGREKSASCATCHGSNGISVGPAIPHIAGQSIDYLYWELVQYHRGDFPALTMTAMVPDTLTDQDLRDMSAYYASLPANAAAANPIPMPEVDAATLAEGERLYLRGDPQKGIPPCQGCHGVDARGQRDAAHVDRSGNRPYSHYPALRGQPQTYLTMRLNLLRDEAMNNSSAEQIMTPISKRMDEESINAVSAWLAQLPR